MCALTSVQAVPAGRAPMLRDQMTNILISVFDIIWRCPAQTCRRNVDLGARGQFDSVTLP
jgi:hypothetical protein